MIRDFYALVRFAVRQKFRTGSFIPPEANGKGTFTLSPFRRPASAKVFNYISLIRQGKE